MAKLGQAAPVATAPVPAPGQFPVAMPQQGMPPAAPQPQWPITPPSTAPVAQQVMPPQGQITWAPPPAPEVEQVSAPTFAQPPVQPQAPAYQPPPGMPSQNGWGQPTAAPALAHVDMSALQQAPLAGGILGLMRNTNLAGVADVVMRLLDTNLEYEAVINKIEGKLSSDNNPMLNLEMTITFPVAYAGCKIWDNVMFTDKSLWKFKSLARATDLLAPDGSVFIGNSEQDFVNNIVRFNVKHDTYEGTTRNKIAGGYTTGYETPGLQAA